MKKKNKEMLISVLVFSLFAFASSTLVTRASNAKPTTCDVCQAAAAAAHVLALYEGWNATTLAGELQTVCGLIPQQYQQQCKLLVLTFGAVECQCIAAPSASFNATECCVDVAVCPSSAAVSIPPRVSSSSSSLASAAAASSSVACSACKAVANLAHLGAQFAGLNGTALDNYLVSLCSSVPVEYESECQQIVQVGGQRVAACVAGAAQTGDQFSAQACCHDIALCPAPSAAHRNALRRRQLLL